MTADLVKVWHEQAGAADFEALRSSRSLASACDPMTVDAQDAMRLFLPPVLNDMVQISRPLPEPHASWCRGFEEAQREAQEFGEPADTAPGSVTPEHSPAGAKEGV